ncbi:MAG: cob(I)yrinic acid a,c-diamide adenosyltransferase [Phycisphaerales bacterium]|nr:cob(I)yrinic acid a,c-diamide adenosyltransferase [Phycisphaerales bacterium]
MKLYTRTGDDGTTGLFSGARVLKHDPRIEAYGTVDETNACIGLVIAACRANEPVEARMLEVFAQIQSRLFDLGADLATPAGAKHSERVMRITEQHVTEAERWIDEFDAMNPPLRAFVMPSGCELAARLHIARTVSRRAERLMVALSMTEAVGAGALQYINRLSDLLFAMARAANHLQGINDIPWIPSTRA